MLIQLIIICHTVPFAVFRPIAWPLDSPFLSSQSKSSSVSSLCLAQIIIVLFCIFSLIHKKLGLPDVAFFIISIKPSHFMFCDLDLLPHFTIYF